MLNYLPPKHASPPTNLESMAKCLKVLAEPNRLLIYQFLMEGVQCNCELGSGLAMAPNLISHHLRVLRDVGLVDVDRDTYDARWMYYSINRQALDELNQACGALMQTIPISDLFQLQSAKADVEIFDPPMCCPTGMCGPTIDQTLLDLDEMRRGVWRPGASVWCDTRCTATRTPFSPMPR